MGVVPAENQDYDDDVFINSAWAVGLAWFAFCLVASSSAWNVYRHLVCYSRPDLQQHVLRIILVGPIYALSAALGLSIDASASFFVRSVRDIWEAVVVYSFLSLIIEYMGGEHLCLQSISQREEEVPHLFPCNLCCKPIPVGQMIRLPKMGALQFVIVKPVLAAISIIVYICGKFEDWYYQWLLFVVYNISYSVALYALYLIYWASHEHPSLQAKRPLMKFLSVKMIVFLTFWQTLLLPHAPLPGSIQRWEDFILAVEMVIFGFLMNAAFSWQEFHSGLLSTKKAMQFDPNDAIELDLATMGQPGATGQPTASGQPSTKTIGRGQVLSNAAGAFCPRDIVADASQNFSRRYQQHVLIECAQEYELRENEKTEHTGRGVAESKGHRTYRAKTYLIGKSLDGATSAGAPANLVGRYGPATGDVALARNVAGVLAEAASPMPSFAASLDTTLQRPLELAPPLHHGFDELAAAAAPQCRTRDTSARAGFFP